MEYETNQPNLRIWWGKLTQTYCCCPKPNLMKVCLHLSFSPQIIKLQRRSGLSWRRCHGGYQRVSRNIGNWNDRGVNGNNLVKILLENLHPRYVGSFYRQPNDRSINQLDELEKSLDYITGLNKTNPNVSIFLGGDFNLGDKNYLDLTVPLTPPIQSICFQLL